MNTFYFEIEKLDNQFEMQLAMEDVFSEGVSDIATKLKSKIKKLLGIFTKYFQDLKTVWKTYKDKRKLHKTIEVCKKAIQQNPKLANEKITFRSYGLNIKEDIPDSEYHKIAANLGQHILAKADERIGNLLEKYEWYVGLSDTFYTIKIKDAIKQMEWTEDSMEKLLDLSKDMLMDFNYYIRTAKEVDISIFHQVKKVMKKIQTKMSRCSNILMMNIEVTIDQLKSKGKKDIEETCKKVRRKELSDDTLIKNAKHWKTLKFQGETYELYKLTNDSIRCFNKKGHYIYLNKEFEKLSEPYQIAIVLHEIGHYNQGHFDNHRGVEDLSKKMKTIRKDVKKYDKLVKKTVFKDIDQIKEGEELLYVLVELEADRFASQFVGKRIMQKALTDSFDRELKKTNVTGEDLEYNHFRMDLRTSML